MHNPLVIENFNPQWSVTFDRIRLELAAALNNLALRIEHVGSTAVPGLSAKPIIDPAHHLYVCAQDSPELRRHLLFRDYLRTHPSTSHAYGALKRKIHAEVAGDRLTYTERKSAFIERVLQDAEELSKRADSGHAAVDPAAN